MYIRNIILNTHIHYIRHIIEQLRLPKRDMNFVHVYY